ncbi:MAG: shikimate dehydrogenase [Solirubrobacteraceae bacterium]
MVRLGVIGWPVAHSRSPAMFEAAFRECGMEHEWSYQKLPVPPELFEQTTRALKGAGFLGANVTIPHKSAALALSDSASPAANAIGAANTLTFGDDGSIAAENTDAPGLISALGCSVEGMRALVLGAGGSARAVVWALSEAGADVSVWNRTHARACRLAEEFGATAVEGAAPADLLVNCTSVGLDSGARRPLASQPSALNQLPLDADQVGEYSYVVDLVYRNGDTPLIAAARSHGAHVVDGLEILVAQGALSFELWTGRPAPREAMRRGAGIQ